MATRESYELSEYAFYESLLGKGVADPNMLGYPGENIMTITELVEETGKLSHNSRELYKQYKAVKDTEDALRAELYERLHAEQLLTAKTTDYTVSIAKKQGMAVKDESAVIKWLEKEGLANENVIGLKLTPFKTLAMAKLKATGEIIDGTELVESEALSVRENKKKK